MMDFQMAADLPADSRKLQPMGPDRIQHRTPNRSLPLLALGLGLGLSGPGMFIGCHHASAPQAEANGSAAALDRVQVGHPEIGSLVLETTQPGRIQAYEEAPLYSKLSGYVARVLVDIGDTVAQGAVLAELAVPELNDEVRQKESLVSLAEAGIQQADAARRAAESAVRTAAAQISRHQAEITRAEGELERWMAEFERHKALAEQGNITGRLVDETRNQLKASQASLQASQAVVKAAEAMQEEAQAQQNQAEADYIAAQAQLKVAQADLDKARTMLAYAVVKAPFAGTITQRGIDTGHYVQPASSDQARPLFILVNSSAVRCFVDVPEMEAPFIEAGAEGDAALISVPALGGRKFEAQVTRTSWAITAVNRSLRTEIDLQNPDGVLRPGMYATVTIQLDQRQDVLIVPVSSLVREVEQTFVCLVVEGKIERRPVKLGLRSGSQVEVVSGLTPSDLIVLKGANNLLPGQPVETLPIAK